MTVHVSKIELSLATTCSVNSAESESILIYPVENSKTDLGENEAAKVEQSSSQIHNTPV